MLAFKPMILKVLDPKIYFTKGLGVGQGCKGWDFVTCGVTGVATGPSKKTKAVSCRVLSFELTVEG